MPETIRIKILIFASGVKRCPTSFISFPTKGADSKAAFEPGRITRRVMKIPPIHITVAEICRK
jgi:hypothetical protein